MRWSWRVLGLLVLLLALSWASLHWLIVPRIDQWRPQLQAWASQALGAELRLGRLEGRSRGWRPTVVAHEVQLLDAEGQPGLTAARVQASLSVPSLLRGGWLQLLVEQPRLEMQRLGPTHWRVAGIDWHLQPDAAQPAALDWLLAQGSLALQGGELRWHDRWRDLVPVRLTHIDAVLSKHRRHHQLRVDATPEPAWGERFTLVARLRRHLVAPGLQPGDGLSGELFFELPRFDAALWRSALDVGQPWGVQEHSGQGGLRLWLDMQRGRLSAATADVALRQLSVQLAPDLPALAFDSLQGRINWRDAPGRRELATQGLQFVDAQGQHWPGGNLRLAQQGEGTQVHGSLHADTLDVAALARLADRLPLPPELRQGLRQHPLSGRIERLQLDWQGDWQTPRDWALQAQAQGLSLPPDPAPEATPPAMGRPGFEGLDVRLQANAHKGHAELHMQEAALHFPGLFEQPRLDVQQLSAQLGWQRREDGHIALEVSELNLANADAEGRFQARWHSGEQADGSGARWPGVLDLQGQLQRADGTAVHRYLPLVIPAEARHYVRDAIRQGQARAVQVQVQGPLQHFPFNQAGQEGVFRIASQVSGVRMDYVPPWLLPQGDLPWPPLEHLAGELVFDRASMQVRGATARVRGHADWRFTDIRADIADLEHARVQVQAQGQGELAQALAIVRDSPAAGLTGHALDAAEGTGPVRLQLALDLPIEHIEQSQVSGQVDLLGNPVRLSPGAPVLAQAQGAVRFSDTGFAIDAVQLRLLGGPAQVSGGMDTRSGSSRVRIHGEGTASAEGLRQMHDWPPVAAAAARASGSANYTLALDFDGPHMALVVESDLQGLQLDWPAPLDKPAQTAWPLRYTQDTGTAPGLSLQLGPVLSLAYAHADADLTQVQGGALALGGAAAQPLPRPERGVQAQVQLPALDLDAWREAAQAWTGGEAQGATGPGRLAGYLPDAWRVDIDQLKLGGRAWHGVRLGGTHQRGAGGRAHWLADVQAQELAGRVEYEEADTDQAGALRLRLAHLRLGEADAPENAPSPGDEASNASHERLPALDVAVDAFELYGKPLGQLQVQARNHAGVWTLAHLGLAVPEARFSAQGQWAAQTAQSGTELDFTLDIDDAGALLTRLGMAEVLRHGKGQLQGRIGWQGSPLALDWPSLQGALKLDVGAGQFLKTEPGVAKLLGVLSLQALPRRLALDFRDVFSSGFAFDFVRGDAQIADGVARSNNLQMKGVNAAVLIDGSADLAQESQQLRVLVVPEIDAGTAALAAGVINPAIGIGAFVAQLVLKQPLMRAATREFDISGRWDNPQVRPVPRGDAVPSPESPTPALAGDAIHIN